VVGSTKDLKPESFSLFKRTRDEPEKGRETRLWQLRHYNPSRPSYPAPHASMPAHKNPAPAKALETFANPAPHRDYQIHMEIPEFTCLCPKTGQPDFAVLTLDYIADKLCVELKSLKLYIWSFRDEGHFHEDVANRILDDLVRATRPRFMRLTARFYVRGGIFTNVVAEHRKKGWKPAPRVELAEFPPQSNTRG
jgi:7-cyano-7-deazaguanine reductase